MVIVEGKLCEPGKGLSCLNLQFYPVHCAPALGTAGDSLGSSPRGRRTNTVRANLSHKWAPPCMPLELFVAKGAQRQESLCFLIGQSRKSAPIWISYQHQLPLMFPRESCLQAVSSKCAFQAAAESSRKPEHRETQAYRSPPRSGAANP